MSDIEKTEPANTSATPSQPQEQPTPAAGQTPTGAAEQKGKPEPLNKPRFERVRRREPGPKRVPALEPERDFAAKPRLKDLDKELEGELEAALSGFTGQELIGDVGQKGPPPQAEGGPKKARVIAVHGADVFVDVPGGRGQGVLPIAQFPDGPPAPGTEVEVAIEGYDRANGLTLLSRRGSSIAQQADWNSVAPGMVVEARVVEKNTGGLTVSVNGIRGFMPISQIDLYRVEETEQFVNQKLLCMVVEVDQADRNLIVSRRALLEKEREEQREKLWSELAEGQVRTGVVRSVRDFGAFVDLGGGDGLLHVSEMSWSRVQDPTKVVEPGQTVKVVVLKVDHERRKVSLGMKQLMTSPWDTIEENYPMGTVVPGKVTKLMEFGAFVELAPGIEGLVHISELAPRRVFRVSDIVKPEQEVRVLVLKIDKEQRKISLSLKQAQAKEAAPPPEPEEEEVEEPVKPPRPRTTPLRGGIGAGFTEIPTPPEAADEETDQPEGPSAS